MSDNMSEALKQASISGIWLCDLCGGMFTHLRSRAKLESHCPACVVGILTVWSGDQINARLKACDDLLAAFQAVKDCCDRDWKDETAEQAAAIVSNAMFWRNEEIRKLRDQNAILSGALNESNRRQRALQSHATSPK